MKNKLQYSNYKFRASFKPVFHLIKLSLMGKQTLKVNMK